MKVLDLRCSNGHGFEGWFASDEAYQDQNGSGLLECPLCADRTITRLLSAPRLNLLGTRDQPPPPSRADAASVSAASGNAARTTAVAKPHPADLQAAWLEAVRQVVARTEDVGEAFPEAARRIHYGEEPARGIRGRATPAEREALHDEGIETMSMPMPAAIKGPVQ
ncbi:MAG: DUF1178 family protein [Rubrivivax sp.]|nr:DUF1178 family protein [Rubrivivax sp.]